MNNVTRSGATLVMPIIFSLCLSASGTDDSLLLDIGDLRGLTSDIFDHGASTSLRGVFQLTKPLTIRKFVDFKSRSGQLTMNLDYQLQGKTIEVDPGKIASLKYRSTEDRQEVYVEVELARFENQRIGNIKLLPNREQIFCTVSTCERTGDKRLKFGKQKIHLYDLDTGSLTNLNIPGNQHVVSWAPDNQRFVFSCTRDKQMNLYIYNFATKEERQLTDLRGWVQHPAWSPDGKWIAFYTNDKKGSYVSIIKPDGTGFRRLTDNVGNGWGIQWGLDGYINFPYHRKPYQIKPDGTSFRQELASPYPPIRKKIKSERKK